MSEITGILTVCLAACSGAYQRNIKASRHVPLSGESTDCHRLSRHRWPVVSTRKGRKWIALLKASNAENVSIWWRHHVDIHNHLEDSVMFLLTHWGRVTHICVSKRTIIGSDNGLSPSRRQAIIWTNAGILLIGPSGTNFSEILIEIITFSFKKMRLKVSSAKWRPCCLGLNVLIKPTFMGGQ